MAREKTVRRVFFGLSALLFMVCAAATISWCGSMAAMGGAPMPGGWWLPATWTLMCGQTWFGAATSFLGMWVVMTVAMMLPSLAPLLWRRRQAIANTRQAWPDRLIALVGVGYFLVWTMFGIVTFPLAAALAAVAIEQPTLARAVPFAAGVVVLIAGALQFTAWKAQHLAFCRTARPSSRTSPTQPSAALGQGLRLGFHCCCSCAGPMAILLVIGVMDLRAMTVVTAAVTAERLAPAGQRIARAIGVAGIGAGVLLIAQASGFA